jgi:hypothetical protein
MNAPLVIEQEIQQQYHRLTEETHRAESEIIHEILKEASEH